MARRLALALVGASALILAACGGESEGGSADVGAEIPTGAAGEGTTISVGLGESGPDAMFVNLSQASAPAGTITFVVTNEGQKEHELIVLATDTPAGVFPIMSKEEAMGGMEEGEEMGHGHDIDEEAPGIEVVDEVEDVESGVTENLTLTLEAGHYALICNIRGHYNAGMWADLQVT